jgi:streptogrisin C
MRVSHTLLCAALVTVGMALAPPAQASQHDAVTDAVARDLGISADAAATRLRQQTEAHRLAGAVTVPNAGMWFDGGLTVAVTTDAAATAVRSVGAQPKLVTRSQSDLAAILAKVTARPGITGYGVDVRHNDVVVRALPGADVGALSTMDGVRIERVASAPVQQAGDVRPGSPWWPGGESNCSIGFAATDASGGKHFVTAGHCTNDANQAAYGESGQRNRIGTSNAGGGRSVNAREGDMGVVAVTEPGWNLSASVNTWGGAPLTVTGVADALVGEAVCHSGNTAPNFQCGTVSAVNQTINYGSVVVEGLTTTTACSEGGDSGGAWLAGDRATGLHSGGQSSCSSPPSADQSIFQPVREALTRWNLTLFTGAGGGDNQAPTAPAGLRSTGTTADSVSLAWSAATDDVGVSAYDVYVGGTRTTTVTGTSATVTGLAANTDYTFTVRARDAAGNTSAPSASVTARTGAGSGTRTFTNGADFPLRDFQVTSSPVTSTATGQAAPARVAVTAAHTCLADLNITVVSPSGRSYLLYRYGQNGWRCEPFGGTRTFAFTPTAEAASGTWTLRIGDNGPGDTGTVDTWSITL